MHQPLQIESQPIASRPNHHVRTDAGGPRNIAARITQPGPVWIVTGCHAQLRMRRVSETLAARLRRAAQASARNANRRKSGNELSSPHGYNFESS